MKETIRHHPFHAAILISALFVSICSGLLFSVTWASSSQKRIEANGVISYRSMIVGVDYWWGFTSNHFVDRDLPLMKDLGNHMLRIKMEPSYLNNLRSLIPTIKQNGIEVLGLLMREDLTNDVDAWGDWVYDIVNEFKPYVKHWEIWNEPNWGTGFQDNPTGYTEFLKRGYTRAKEADPTCVIMGGAVLGCQDSSVDYVRSMYDNGAKDYMDALSVHPYCGPNPPEYPHANSWPSGFWMLQKYRDLMVEYGDGDKKIWVTEMGWNTAGANPVSEEEQADYLVRALGMAQDWGWVEAFIIYNWIDGGTLYYGLLEADRTQKPSIFAVKDFI